jgi:hypothetical protein
MLLGPTTAAGADSGEFAGYRAEALAQPLTVAPFFPSLLPYVDSPFEGTLGLGYSNVVSSDTAFARSSAIWPGTVLAGLGPLVGQAGSADLGKQIPPYPAVAEAHANSGDVNNTRIPLTTIHAFGSPTAARTDTQIPTVSVASVLSVASMASRTEAKLGDRVASSATASVHGVSIMGGQITIGSVTSVVSGATDGVAATTKGGVKVVDLVIGGVNASVDESGVHAAGQGQAPGTNPNGQIAQVLSSLGVKITVVGTDGESSGPRAERSGGGLMVSITTPALGTVPNGRMVVVLGATSVSLDASPALDLSGFLDDLTAASPFTSGAPPGVDTSVAGTQFSFTSPVDVGATGPLGGGTGGGSGITGAPALRTASVAYRFGGIPLGLVAVTILAVFVLGWYLRRFVERLLGPGE